VGQPLFQLLPGDGPDRWRLPLTQALSVGPGDDLFMFGGVGLAAAVRALEATLSRPLAWATAHYLAAARPPADLELEVRTLAAGRRVTHARVVGRAGAAEVLAVSAALGGDADGPARQWLHPPAIAPPGDCTPIVLWPGQEGNLNGRLEVRTPLGPPRRDGTPSDDGRFVAWLRTCEGDAPDAALLAVFADYVPAALGVALGRYGGGSSLDNTLRIHGVAPTDWVLADAQISGVRSGLAHGAIRLFAEDGRLLATGSQSMVVRLLD